MESKTAQAIGLKHNPVAVVLADEKPEKALQFKKAKQGCVMFMFANAARGRSAAFDAETCGCPGGAVGLGFGNAYHYFPGGVDCFARFLSSGNSGWEKGEQVAEGLKGAAGEEFTDDFIYGERYKKSPELVEQWIEELPITQIRTRYVLFEPLSQTDPGSKTPENVVFTVDADQLSALVILANYTRKGMENVSIPWAAGCQNIGILPWHEAESETPRAVVGLTDISARKAVRKLLGREYLTFAVPWKMFLEMEENVEGSFLERPTWRSIQETKS
ncbi:MAG: DUF169 domain-containing protein [Desulfosalsimonas sp.]